MHLNAHLDLDLVAVDSEDTVTLLLELQAPAAPQREQRPEHTAVVVLDRSGSMAGHRLAAAQRALLDLVARLDDRDRFSLVTFDNHAQAIVPAGRVGDIGRDRLRRDIASIRPGGMTDLSSGYLRGLQEARRVCGPAGATLVLLSDGRANSGVTDAAQLASVAGNAATEHAVTTSTIGIGTDYDDSILAALAEGGRGNHSFAEHADAAAAAVAGEIDGLLGKSVQAANLLIRPAAGVSEVRIMNDGLPTWRSEAGVGVELGDFYAGEQRKLVITLTVAAMARLGLSEVAELVLTFVELPGLQQQTVTLPVSVNVVPADVAAGRVRDAQVVREELLLRAQAAKRDAEDDVRRGDERAAQQRLTSAIDALQGAGAEVFDAELAQERDWLRITADEITDRERRQYNLRRMSSDRVRKSRGYKNRTQGGQTQPDSRPSDGI